MHSNSYATRLIYDDDDENRVIGINYIKNGEYMTAYTRNDVILSAGSFSTPGKLTNIISFFFC